MYNINTPTNTFRDSSYILTPEEEIYIQISVEFHNTKKYDAAIPISWKNVFKYFSSIASFAKFNSSWRFYRMGLATEK